MSRSVLRLTYTDGSTFDAKLNARALVHAERHFGETMPKIEGSLYAAWVQAAPGVDFDAWLDTVETVEDVAVDPTSAAPSEESPDSQ